MNLTSSLLPASVRWRGRLLSTLALAGLSSALAAPGCAASGTTTGAAASTGGALGSFEFTPDRCRWREDIRAFDFSAEGSPVTVRYLYQDRRVVVANRNAPGGAKELVMSKGAECRIFNGYTHQPTLARRDANAGIRFICDQPGGGQVSGTLGSGACQ